MGFPEGAAGRPRIVVADDDEAVLLTLTAILREVQGAAVEPAAGYEQALRRVQDQATDLLVTELTIDQPEDGLGLLRAARERSPGVACIVLTGSASLQSAIAALRMGVANYLLKPCNIEELKVAVRAALEPASGGDAQAMRSALREAERTATEAEQRAAGRVVVPLSSLRERIGRLKEQAERLALSDSVRYDIQQVDLAASRLEAAVDTLLEPIRDDVQGPSRTRQV